MLAIIDESLDLWKIPEVWEFSLNNSTLENDGRRINCMDHIIMWGSTLYETEPWSSYCCDESTAEHMHMCGKKMELNRTGTLCGKCQDGYYPLVPSVWNVSMQCPNGKSNWWKFVLAAFLPLTVFYLTILFFQINVVSSQFQGFLFYSQIVSMPAIMRAVVFFDNHSNNHVTTITTMRSFTLYGNLSMSYFVCLEDTGIQGLQ